MANDAQIDYWNAIAGPEWVRRQKHFDTMLAPFGAAALDAADAQPGDAVLDVGCGCGTTTLELARRVGPTGRVLGVDVSAPMLAVARGRAGATVELVEADAQAYPFPTETFDIVFSRMGVMFFDDPVAAFSNLRRAIAPGGRLAFVCWQPLAENEWIATPLGALRSIVTLPPLPPAGTPGPFAFGDATHVRRILESAGWSDVACEPYAAEVPLGGEAGLAGAVEHIAETSLMRTALAGVDEVTRTRALAAMRVALEAHVDDHGSVRVGGAAWVVRAA